MISYLVKHGWHNPIEDYRQSWGQPICELIKICSYEWFLDSPHLDSCLYIFSDLERLSPAEAEKAAKIWSNILSQNPTAILLNHPTHSMRRYELLRHLYSAGLNKYQAYRVTDCLKPARFPVFLKKEHDHTTNLSSLLYSESDLSQAIAELNKQGISREDTLIIEFLDTADLQGVYRKYSAFVLAGFVIPRHIFFSTNWLIKVADLLDDSFIDEELEFIHSNPHAAQILDVFSLANISYGRIDYSLYKGQLQVWEINTNPQVVHFKIPGAAKRMEAAKIFSQQFNALLRTLEARAKPKRLTRKLVNSKFPLAELIEKASNKLELKRYLHQEKESPFYNSALSIYLKEVELKDAKIDLVLEN